MARIRFKRGTRAQLDAAAAVGGLAAGEPYLITDEERSAVGTGSNTYIAVAKQSELGMKATVTLAPSAFVDINAELGDKFRLVLDRDVSLKAPVNVVDGEEIQITVSQGAIGGHALSFSAGFKWPAGVTPSFGVSPWTGAQIAARFDEATSTFLCEYRGDYFLAPKIVLPEIPDNNASINFEGDVTEGWVTSGATLSATGGWLRMTKTAAAGTNARMTMTPPVRSVDEDFIIYSKVRLKDAPGSGGVLWLSDGTIDLMGAWFNYDARGTPKVEAGTVSIQGYTSSAQTALAATGLDLENNALEFALHYDSKFHSLSCYFRQTDGSWDLKARVAHQWKYQPSFEWVSLSSSPAGWWLEFDYLTVAKPNIVVVGDSIAEGKNLFSPNLSLGLSDYSNTWARYFTAYPTQRNNLVVNKAVGGESSAATLARIADVTSTGARVVFLHASSNDLPGSVSLSARTSSITSTVSAIAATGAKTVLLNACYASSTHPANPAYRNYLKSWWDTSSGSVGADVTVDIMSPLLGVDGFLRPALVQADNIHIKPAGYQLIGRHLS